MKQSKNGHENVQTRKEFRQKKNLQKNRITDSAHARKQKNMKIKQELAKKKRPRRRIFPIWLRIIFISICCVLALAVGLMIGFGVLGDGEPRDALKVETWQHIIDFVTKD